MFKNKKRRLRALQALENLCNSEMETLKDKGRVAREQLKAVENKLSLIDRDIQQVEERLRAGMDSGRSVSVDEFRMMGDYLLERHHVRLNQERQRQYADKQFEAIGEEIKQQHLKIRGVNRVQSRQARELGFELQKRQIIELDETWLLRQGKDND